MTTNEYEGEVTPGTHNELWAPAVTSLAKREAAAPQAQQQALDARALFCAHATFVAAFARRLGVRSADVDDVVQEVFLIAHRKGGFVPGAGQPRTWLASIALRVASTSRRALSRRREDANGHEQIDARQGDGDPARALEVKRSLERVDKALDALDLEQRGAFVLYELAGESCEAIATSFGVPVGTIYSRLHYARKAFTEAYAAIARTPAKEGT